MDTYAEFIIKNSQALKTIAEASWWSFVQQESTWLVRGKAVSSAASMYCVLLTDLNSVFFAVAGTSQITKEIKVRAI